MQATELPLHSRLFVVCGRSVEEDTLKQAFLPYGNVENIKLIKEKGVCFVKYDKASSAALAMESLNGAVLNNGRGPKLKVLLAEAPTPRGLQQPVQPKLLLPDQEAVSDPDNIPPRSRLFLVVPKTAEARLIHDELARYPDLEYCKTDLIASKGVVFVKYAKASSALRALEEIAAKGMLGSYKVKVMLAEPKTKRQRPEQLVPGLFGPVGALGHLPPLGLDAASAMRLNPAAAAAAAAGQFGAFGLNAATASSMLAAQQAAALNAGAAAAATAQSGGSGDYTPLQGFMGFNNAAGLAAAAAAAAGGGAGMDQLSNQMSLQGFGLGPTGPLMNPLSTPDGSGMSGFNQATAAAATGASNPAGGGFQSSPGNNSSMGSVSSSLTNVNFPLAPFMGLSPGGAHGNVMMSQMAAAAAAAQQGLAAGPHDLAAVALTAAAGAAGPPLSQQRLFVVVHKSVSDDQLRLLFRQYPGMEYCDLKRDKATGKSKGYCYVNYSTPQAAAAAVNELNGIEFPVGSGFRLKVMYAEIMTGGGASSTTAAAATAAASAAALMRSSSSRSSLRTPSSGQLAALARASSGQLAHQHSSSSGQLAGQPPVGPVSVHHLTGGSTPGGLAVHASGPSSTGGAPGAGSRGPSPAATPILAQQHSVPGSEAGHVADSLSSLSLQSLAGPAQTMGSISSEPCSEAAAAAAAVHHFEHLQAAAAAGHVGSSGMGNSVARELMFNVG